MATMRTAQLFGVDDMRFVESPMPEPRPGEVLVRTHMASICGSDLHVVCHGAGIVHEFPCPHGYPGHEAVGEIVEVATGDTAPAHSRVGQRVLCFPTVPKGEGFSEFQRIEPQYLLPLPNAMGPNQGVTDAELLMAQQLGTVIFAARKRPIDVIGKTVLILGQGSAGLFWTYWLKRQGAARIIVADLSPARLAASPTFGADVMINPNEDDLASAIRDLTGAGADYVVEAVGSPQALNLSIELSRPDGDLIWFGLPDTNDLVPVNFAKFFRKRLTTTSTYGAQSEPGATSFQTALELIATSQIDVTPLLSHVYPIDDISTAFAVANQPIADGALKVSVSF